MILRIFLAWLAFAVPVAAGPALVVEPTSGTVLYSEEADRPWHPASLTKLMTAYLAFEAIRDGKLSPEDKLTCSEHALRQEPSKIGLPLGGQLTVDLALKALIIKSANDVAVMLAERIAGSEAAFAARMNEAASRLGMKRTHFVNASGLPDDAQVTTARDLAQLARALLREFPQYTPIYGLASYKAGGMMLRSHNGLLSSFAGADGMKTGFICASGYNVVASATRDGRRIIAVVLGERSGGARTVRASALIEKGFETYLWKSLFSTTLDGLAADTTLLATPGNMRADVCPVRPARIRRSRKGKGKPKGRVAEAEAVLEADARQAGPNVLAPTVPKPIGASVLGIAKPKVAGPAKAVKPAAVGPRSSARPTAPPVGVAPAAKIVPARPAPVKANATSGVRG